jgi:hypothetical protein
MGDPGDVLVSARWVSLDRPAASELDQLILQCDECPAGTTICPGSFDDVAAESRHRRSLCQ